MVKAMKFHTDYVFTDRETKAKYVWEKYHSILMGRHILDVGADECHLKQYLDDEASYWGVGLGGNPDQQVDLEKGPLPFDNGSFDSVLCLDVLEHLESIHRTFDELCRVTRKFVIVSLPNAFGSFHKACQSGNSYPRLMKFYGLPLEPPSDRHRWFFSYDEAEEFIEYRAQKNGMSILQIDPPPGRSKYQELRLRLRWRKYDWDIVRNFYHPMLWAVLEKDKGS